jgi:hypothetical protein
MRRFLPAAVIALLLVAVATPANAGYLIIRVILEGGGPGGSYGGDDMGGLGSGMRPGGSGGFGRGMSSASPPGGSGGFGRGMSSASPPGGSGGFGRGMSSASPPGGLLGPSPSAPGGLSAPSGPAPHDPTRSLVLVVPVEEDLRKGTAFYQKYGSNQFTNPIWRPKLHLKHRGERFITNIFTDSVSVQIYENLIQTPGVRRTRATDIHDLHQKWAKSKTDSKILFNALTDALETGMIEESVAYADELLSFASAKTDGLPPEVAAFAQAYKAMQTAIKSPASKSNAAEEWRLRLKAQGVSPQAHYSIIYWDSTDSEIRRRAAMLEENFKGFFLWHATRGIALPVPDAPLIAVLPKSGSDVFRLARALDASTRLPADGFYSAEHDVLVLSPERLDDLGSSYARQAQQVYQAGISRDILLRGDGPKLHVNELNGAKRPEEVARMQTTALVDRLVEDAATMAAISREGSRQLLTATGRLPRYVELPDWLAHGSGNFFTRPKDPAFISDADDKWSMAVAPTTGYGGPNYTLQRYFRDLLEKKDLHPDRGQLLKNVLTDAYFRGLRDPKDATDPDPIKPDAKAIAMAGGGASATASSPLGGSGFSGSPGSYSRGAGTMQRPGGSSGMRPPGAGSPSGFSGMRGGGLLGGAGMEMTGGGRQPVIATGEPEEHESVILRRKRDKLSIKAHATAWALYYYLAKDHPEKLGRFLDELSALPRDLPLDGDTVVAVFCRSFGLENSKESLTRFANAWIDYIRVVPSVSFDIALVEPKLSSSPAGGPLGGLPGTPSAPGVP